MRKIGNYDTSIYIVCKMAAIFAYGVWGFKWMSEKPWWKTNGHLWTNHNKKGLSFSCKQDNVLFYNVK